MVDQNCQDLCSDSSNWMTSLAGSGFKTEEDHLNLKTVTALLFIIPAHCLVIWKYDSQKNKLKIHPIFLMWPSHWIETHVYCTIYIRA